MKIAIKYLDPKTKKPVAWCVGDLDQLKDIKRLAKANLYLYCGRTKTKASAYERVAATSTGQRIDFGEC
jgi:biotin synthase-like enzyme